MIGSAPVKPGSLQIQGADGPVEIPSGEWYQNPKERPRQAIKRDLSSGAWRVHIYLELHTQPWRRDDAIIPDKNGQIIAEGVRCRHITTTDIARDLGMNEGDVRRFLAELQSAGLGERRAKDGGALHKGNVVIYSYSTPRPVQDPGFRGRAHGKTPDWIEESEELKPAIDYFKRKRWQIPELNGDARTLFLEDFKRAARALQEAENQMARVYDSVRAPDALYKEERTERTIEKEEAGQQASSVVVVEEERLPACDPGIQENAGNATPPLPATIEEIQASPAVQALERQLHDAMTPTLAAEVAAELADAPVESLNQRIQAKRDIRSLGLLRNLAADVRRAHNNGKGYSETMAAAAAAQMQGQVARFVQDLKTGWRNLTEADRQMARETYPEVDWPG